MQVGRTIKTPLPWTKVGKIFLDPLYMYIMLGQILPLVAKCTSLKVLKSDFVLGIS